jgi:hypothetical protein
MDVLPTIWGARDVAGYEDIYGDIGLDQIAGFECQDQRFVIPLTKPFDQQWVDAFVELAHRRRDQSSEQAWGPVWLETTPDTGYSPPRGRGKLTVSEVRSATDIPRLLAYLSDLVDETNRVASRRREEPPE